MTQRSVHAGCATAWGLFFTREKDVDEILLSQCMYVHPCFIYVSLRLTNAVSASMQRHSITVMDTSLEHYYPALLLFYRVNINVPHTLPIRYAKCAAAGDMPTYAGLLRGFMKLLTLAGSAQCLKTLLMPEINV